MDMCIYIVKIQVSTNIQPNGSSLYKDVLYDMPIQRGLIYNMFQKKDTNQESKITQAAA